VYAQFLIVITNGFIFKAPVARYKLVCWEITHIYFWASIADAVDSKGFLGDMGEIKGNFS
jgi:hypothetical protein